MGDTIGLLQMLGVLIFGTQATTQLRDTNGRNGLEKTTKMYFTLRTEKLWNMKVTVMER